MVLKKSRSNKPLRISKLFWGPILEKTQKSQKSCQIISLDFLVLSGGEIHQILEKVLSFGAWRGHTQWEEGLGLIWRRNEWKKSENTTLKKKKITDGRYVKITAITGVILAIFCP